MIYYKLPFWVLLVVQKFLTLISLGSTPLNDAPVYVYVHIGQYSLSVRYCLSSTNCVASSHVRPIRPSITVSFLSLQSSAGIPAGLWHFNMSCLGVMLQVRGRDGMCTPQNGAAAYSQSRVSRICQGGLPLSSQRFSSSWVSSCSRSFLTAEDFLWTYCLQPATSFWCRLCVSGSYTSIVSVLHYIAKFENSNKQTNFYLYRQN